MKKLLYIGIIVAVVALFGFILSKNKAQNEAETAVVAQKNSSVAVKTETIKKGSPHILRIIKTEAAYHRQMKDWKEDLVLLDKISAQMSPTNSQIK